MERFHSFTGSLLVMVLLLMVAVSCREKTGDQSQSKVEKIYVPDAAQLFSKQDVEEALNLQSGAVYEVSPSYKEHSSTAFFRFDDPEKPNAAILISAQVNPIPEEYYNYADSYIEGLKSRGEMTVGSDEADIYKDFTVAGEPGAYSLKSRFFYWKDHDDHVYFLAFNTSHTDEQVYQAAVKLAERAMQK